VAHKAGLATTMYQKLSDYHDQLLSRLKPGYALRIFAATTSGKVPVTGISYELPHLIVFESIGVDGQMTYLVQHVSQVNLTFEVQKTDSRNPAPKIGFNPPKDPPPAGSPKPDPTEGDQAKDDDDDDVHFPRE